MLGDMIKTANCPKCNEEMDSLIVTRPATIVEDFRILGEDEAKYSEENIIRDSYKEAEYSCPNCGETVAEGEEEARGLFEKK